MLISIIIPTYNRSQYILKTLESLVKQKIDPALFEILIIDNNSTDATLEISQKFIAENINFRIKYFFEPIPGLLSGRHRGLKESSGEILIFIDDDIIADEQWLISIISSFKDPSINIVGGRNLPMYEVEPPGWLKYFWLSTEAGVFCGQLSLLDFGESPKFIDPNFVWGLNFSIRKSTLIELGGFHPDTMPPKIQFLQGDGETGLTIKAKEKNILGYYQPNALIYHVVPKERLTIDYFIKRHFFQGVADSYTESRVQDRQRVRSRILKSFYKKYSFILNSKLRLFFHIGNIAKIEIYTNCNNAYCDGKIFHQRALINDNNLLHWISKENYLDYTLPYILD